MTQIKPKAARVNCGISQEEMAKKMGISLSSLSNKENGRTEFTKREAEHYAAIVGLPEKDIDFLWTDRIRK